MKHLLLLVAVFGLTQFSCKKGLTDCNPASLEGKWIMVSVKENVSGLTTIKPSSIVVLTTTGHTAHSIAAERPKTNVIAIARSPQVYHALNLFWGLKPLLEKEEPADFDGLVKQAASTLRARGLVKPGDKILVIGGVPTPSPPGANFVKIHSISSD